MSIQNILLLEDDFTLSQEIKFFLEQNEFVCDCVFDGSLVLKQYRLKSYDLILLDINVPSINGFEVCRALRQTDTKTPIMMLTAFGEIDDKTTAYNFGADDYIVKPFHFKELLLRIKSLLRRSEIPQIQNSVFQVANLIIDLTESKVTRNNVSIELTPKEFKLLHILALAKGRILSKQQIAENLWDESIETNQNTIEVYINFLRKKIDKAFENKLIHTKIGYGYYLKNEV